MRVPDAPTPVAHLRVGHNQALVALAVVPPFILVHLPLVHPPERPWRLAGPRAGGRQSAWARAAPSEEAENEKGEEQEEEQRLSAAACAGTATPTQGRERRKPRPRRPWRSRATPGSCRLPLHWPLQRKGQRPSYVLAQRQETPEVTFTPGRRKQELQRARGGAYEVSAGRKQGLQRAGGGAGIGGPGLGGRKPEHRLPGRWRIQVLPVTPSGYRTVLCSPLIGSCCHSHLNSCR